MYTLDMNNLLKNLCILRSEWIPNSPVDTFKPFVIELIRSEEIVKTKIEKLSENYEHKYGYKLPLFILKPILNSLVDIGLAELPPHRNEWTFDMSLAPNKNLDLKAAHFEEKYNNFVQGFVNFCSSYQKIPFKQAEQIILKFINANSNDPLFYQSGGLMQETDDVHLFFLSRYLRELQGSDKNLFKFFGDLCESVLIASFMFNEDLQQGTFANTKVYVDAPIIFGLLGYRGEYYQQEYKFLFDCLLKQGCELSVFYQNYSEVMRVLQEAEKWVDSISYDPSVASRVCEFFRSKGKSRPYVTQEIVLLEKNLKSLNIKIANEIDWNTNQMFVESHQEIRDTIIAEYLTSTMTTPIRKNPENLPEDAIEVDVRSVLDIYFLRKNNRVRLLKDAAMFYISDNNAFVRAVRKYNNSKYKNTIPPVLNLTFLGMVVTSESPDLLSTVVNNRILSFAHSVFKPKHSVRKKFIEQLEKEKADGKISEPDYLAIKHNAYVNEFLFECVGNNLDGINQDTAPQILEMVHSQILGDHKRTHEKEKRALLEQMQEMEKTHEEEKQEIKKSHREELLDKSRIRYKKTKFWCSIPFFCALPLVWTVMGFLVIAPWFLLPDWDGWLKTMFSIVSACVLAISLPFKLLPAKKNLDNLRIKLLTAKRRKIADFDGVTAEDIPL